MAREAREESLSGVYHIVLKGNDRLLFAELSDYLKFMELVKKQAELTFMEVCAYCLFSEAAHLVLKEGLADISDSIKAITSAYARWCNVKYGRKGRLFHDRFASEPIEIDDLLDVVLFTHRLPIERGYGVDYEYSSYNLYAKKGYSGGAIMLLFDNSVTKFKEFTAENTAKRHYLTDLKSEKLSDDALREQIKTLLDGVEQSEIDALEAKEFKALIHRFKKIEGASIRQLARVLDLSKSYVEKA